MSKWTIFNNTLTWNALSNEQKGKFLLHTHNGGLTDFDSEFEQGFTSVIEPPSWGSNDVYRAEAEKPELWEVFLYDYMEGGTNISANCKHMISLGWTKTK